MPAEMSAPVVSTESMLESMTNVKIAWHLLRHQKQLTPNAAALKKLLSGPSGQSWLMTCQKPDFVEHCYQLMDHARVVWLTDDNYDTKLEGILKQLAECGESLNVTARLHVVRQVIRFAASTNDLNFFKVESLRFLRSIVRSFSDEHLNEIRMILSEREFPIQTRVVSEGILCPLLSKWYIQSGRKVDHFLLHVLSTKKDLSVEGFIACQNCFRQHLCNRDSLKEIFELIAAEQDPLTNTTISYEFRMRWNDFIFRLVCNSNDELRLWTSVAPIKEINLRGSGRYHGFVASKFDRLFQIIVQRKEFDKWDDFCPNFVEILRNRLGLECEASVFDRFDCMLPLDSPLRAFTSSVATRLSDGHLNVSRSQVLLLIPEKSLNLLKLLLSPNKLLDHVLGSRDASVPQTCVDDIRAVIPIVASKEAQPRDAADFCLSIHSLVQKMRNEIFSVLEPESMSIADLRIATELRKKMGNPNLLVDLDAKLDELMFRHSALERLHDCLPETSAFRNWLLELSIYAPTIKKNCLLKDAAIEFHPLLLEVGDAMEIISNVCTFAESNRDLFRKHACWLDRPQGTQTLVSVLTPLIAILQADIPAPPTFSQLSHESEAPALMTLQPTTGKGAQPRFPRCDIADLCCHEPPIGDGSTCDVYRAMWRGKECAFKKYRRSVAREIEREMCVAPFLQHDFTVRVLAIVEECSKPVGLLLELCEGSLGTAIAADCPPARTTTLRWLYEVAQAVDFAHSCNVVHSDIKPDNILLHRNGDEKHAKLADFGSSFILSTLATVSTNARGTPLFIAPEYGEGDTGPTPAADIFSFGMTMWSVLCPSGTPHGLGQHSRHIEKALLNEERPPLAGIEPVLSTLIAQCWHQKPSQRPSAAALADALRIECDKPVAVASLTTASPPATELWETILLSANLVGPYRALQWQQSDIFDLFFSSPLATPGEPCFEFLASQLDPQFSRNRITHFNMVGLGHSTTRSFLTIHRAEAQTRALNEFLRIQNPASTTAAVEQLTKAFLPTTQEERSTSRIVLAWHGMSVENVLSICRDRPRSLRTTDAGYFGAGSYFALEASYAAQHPKNSNDDQNESPKGRAMGLFAVSVSQAKVITVADDYRLLEDDRTPHLHGFSNFYSGDPQLAVALAPKYDAHFIPVRWYGHTHPRMPQIHTPVDIDYQAADEHQATAHELVISSHHRCVPLAVMYYV